MKLIHDMSQLYKPDLKVETEDDFNSNGKLFHKVINYTRYIREKKIICV